jgi:hypothetical protein
MELLMKLNLWPVTGINVYDLPEGIRAMFPYYSANEEDCIPQHEQTKPDSHRELKADEEGENANLANISDVPNVLNMFNR